MLTPGNWRDEPVKLPFGMVSPSAVSEALRLSRDRGQNELQATVSSILLLPLTLLVTP